MRLTPKSSRDSLDGIVVSADGRAQVLARVRAVPEKGQANAALVRLVARSLGCPPSSVSVVAGGTARLKTLRIAGGPEELLTRLKPVLFS